MKITIKSVVLPIHIYLFSLKYPLKTKYQQQKKNEEVT